jgi:DNA mismatch endonuclease, patch repair protein
MQPSGLLATQFTLAWSPRLRVAGCCRSGLRYPGLCGLPILWRFRRLLARHPSRAQIVGMKRPFSETTPKMRLRMSRQKARDTGPEMLLRRALHRRGLRYQLHVAPVPGLQRRADIVFPRQRIAIFVDGCYWHGCPEHGTQPRKNAAYWSQKIASNKLRDADTTAQLKAAGWRVLRVWEHELADSVAHQVWELVRGFDGSTPNCGDY